MSWHSCGWPGQLPLLLSTNPTEVEACVARLNEDRQCLEKCEELAPRSLFFQNAAKLSPFRFRVMAELLEMLQPDGTFSEANLRVVKYQVAELFGGWGQTKVIEDANKQVRELESQGSLKKVVGRASAWDTMRSKGVLESHGRPEVDPDLVGIPETAPVT
eukprot:1983899-Lingulodinium_polyedra.AAC.1